MLSSKLSSSSSSSSSSSGAGLVSASRTRSWWCRRWCRTPGPRCRCAWLLGSPSDDTLAVDYGRQVLSALHFLHSLSPPVLHRDLKYANLLVDGQGAVPLTDLGVSKAQGERAMPGWPDVGCWGSSRGLPLR